MPHIVTQLINILEKKCTCQTAHEEQEPEEEEDVEDMELILIEAVCDSIVDLVKTLGPLSDAYFAALVQSVSKYQVCLHSGESDACFRTKQRRQVIDRWRSELSQNCQ
jgi:hypothetical protein